MQMRINRGRYRKPRLKGWHKVRYQLVTVMPHLEYFFREGKHLPEGWARIENGKIIEAYYVDYSPDTKRWNVNHYPSGDILDVADTKKEALTLARLEIELRQEGIL